MPATGTLEASPAVGVPVLLAALALATVAVAAATGASGVASLNAEAVAAGDIDRTVLAGDRDMLAIAGRNLGAAALLAAGAPMLGIATVFAVAVLGMGIGFSGAAVVAVLGPVETISRIAPYIAFELSGVVLAAAAGILPTVHALSTAARPARGVPFTHAYTRGLATSLALAGVAAVLILIGAAIEAVVITAQLP